MCFPYNNFGSFSTLTNTYVSNSIPLTSTQQSALKTEYTSDPTARGYAGKTAAEITVLMNSGYLIPNPVAQGYLASLDKETFMHNVLSPILNYIQSAPITSTYTTTVQQSFVSEVGSFVSFFITQVNNVYLNDPNVARITSALISAGVMTQAQLNTLTIIPDPTWVATIPEPARSQVIFNIPLTLEVADVTAATGVN